MNARKGIGKRIELARRELSWNQDQLGEHLGLSQKAISRWESGKVGIDADVLADVARILGKPIEYFYLPVGEAAVPKAQSPGARAKKKKAA